MATNSKASFQSGGGGGDARSEEEDTSDDNLEHGYVTVLYGDVHGGMCRPFQVFIYGFLRLTPQPDQSTDMAPLPSPDHEKKGPADGPRAGPVQCNGVNPAHEFRHTSPS